MIWEILPLSLIFIGFGGAMILLVRKFRHVSEEEIDLIWQNSRLVKSIKSFYSERIKPKLETRKIESWILLFLEKSLRWLRVMAMKFENWLTKRIESVKNLRLPPESDPMYWLAVRRSALEKRIEEVLDKDFSPRFDPHKEEVKLLRKNIEAVEDWLRIAKFHLDSENLAEARRLIVKSWFLNPGNEKIRLLLEDFELKVEEAKIKTENGNGDKY